MSAEELTGIADELDRLSERLADCAIDLLGEAMGDPDPKASPAARQERMVTRARRSVEKASALLRGPGDEEA